MRTKGQIGVISMDAREKLSLSVAGSTFSARSEAVENNTVLVINMFTLKSMIRMANKSTIKNAVRSALRSASEIKI